MRVSEHLATMMVVSDTREVCVARDKGSASRREAARIWAVATAHRDGEPVPAPVAAALPIIERGLQPAGSALHLAYLDTLAVGFAVVVPRGGSLEILYLGVDPDAWGMGVASRLLVDVTGYAVETARCEVDLWVYDDNVRAVNVYRRAGWRATNDVRTRATSRRRERRYVSRVAEHAGELEEH